MKRILLILAICLLTTISSFSQSSYPKKITVGNNTLVLITDMQLRAINSLLVDRLMYREIVQDFRLKVDSVNAEIVKMNDLNDNKSKLINLQQKQIKDLENLSRLADEKVTLLNKEIKLQKKRKVKSTFIGIATTALVTTTAVLLLK